jgi:hypothetical protein
MKNKFFLYYQVNYFLSTVNREIVAALKVGEFAFFSICGRQNSALAAEI